jgi:hypothetical protein
VTVTAADRLEVIEGTATKILLALRYDGNADGLPERMWIKSGFGDHREFTGNLGVYRSEVLFFTDIATAYRLHHPRSYFALAQDEPVLDLLDRRAHERDLLGGYIKTLASYGVPVPGSGEAWESYRRTTVYGFICWLCNPDIWQPPDVNAATFARFGMAMLDHDTYEAIGV